MFIQLLKTTPYLSGQHRLDVCLKKSTSTSNKNYDHTRNEWLVTTGKCHLSPLSDGIVYTDSIERPFFNQTYGDNLKFLYRQIKDDFFRNVPAITAKNILYEDDIWIDTTDHTYECGLKRLRYEKYKKQFSWLCPLWIEDPNVFDYLYFIMTISGDEAERHSMKIRITPSQELIDSLKEWYKGVSSDLLYIDIENERATIKGASVYSGTPVTADVSYIIPQLLDRERPVMETNSTLNQLFSSNNMIAKQLLNLNFCFSPEDIIPSHIINEFIGKRWKITIDTYYYDKKIDKMDFLSNYESLPTYLINGDSGKWSSKHNVFDYLEDNNYVDYMYINKTTQVDPYWALVENPNYIYNFYNGFSSWYVSSDGDNQIMGLSQSQPDVAHDEYDYRFNNLGWCEIYDYHNVIGWNESDMDYSNIIPNLNHSYEATKKSTRIVIKTGEVCWINGIKFNCQNLSQNFNEDFRLFMCLTGDDASHGLQAEKIDNGVYCLFLPTNNQNSTINFKDLLTVKSIANNPNITIGGDAEASGKITNLFKYVFPTLIYPEKVIFRKSIQPVRAESPFEDSKEITYIKQEYNVNSYVYRYSGALRPYFIELDDKVYNNIDYFFKKWSKEDTADVSSDKYKELKRYNKMLNTKYDAVFPSKDFYGITNNGRIKYLDYPDRYKNLGCEFQWYMDGRFYVLPPVIELSFVEETRIEVNNERLMNELISKLRFNFYPFTNIDNGIAVKQIANLYSCTIDYDYASDTDITRQIFRVKYTLR